MTRPLDTWRVCGHRVNDHSGDRGCTCKPQDPSSRLAQTAVARLADEETPMAKAQVPA